MSWFKKLLVTATGIFIAQTLQAQTHNNAWFRTTLSLPVGEKFKIDNEFQHRRQNGFDNNNLFDKNQMFTYRNWVHYPYSKDVKFSVSPFAYFSNYKIIQKQADQTAEPNKEIRFSAAVELQHELFKSFYITNRNALEYRIFDNNQSDITRFRTRFGGKYELSENLKLGIFDELLLNVSGVITEHFFDQNRIGLNLEYRVLPHLKFDIGYIYLTRLPLTANKIKLCENNIVLNFTYQLQTHKSHKGKS